LWSDCEDHWKWVFTELPKLLNIKFDTSKIASIGESAGGYLALLSGYKLIPRPNFIIDYFGFVNWESNFYNIPASNIPPEQQMSADVLKLIGYKPLSGDLIWKADRNLAPRAYLFFYFLQKALLLKECFGLNPHQHPEDLDKLSPWMPAKNITKGFPATLIYHSRDDSLVPFEDSENLVEALKKHGVEHIFVALDKQGHGFCFNYKKGEAEYGSYVNTAYLWLKFYFSVK